MVARDTYMSVLRPRFCGALHCIALHSFHVVGLVWSAFPDEQGFPRISSRSRWDDEREASNIFMYSKYVNMISAHNTNCAVSGEGIPLNPTQRHY